MSSAELLLAWIGFGEDRSGTEERMAETLTLFTGIFVPTPTELARVEIYPFEPRLGHGMHQLNTTFNYKYLTWSVLGLSKVCHGCL